jgi:hypothetical protein
MRYAILSDIHGRLRKLQAALTDARARGAQQIVSLGDVGGEDCLDLLRRAGATAEDFGDWLKRTGQSWRALFPYLDEDPDHLWLALGELELAAQSILFHGHTHQQAAWHWQPPGRLRRLQATAFNIQPGHRYVVGVGSVGLPEDGGWAAYTLYDAQSGRVELVRLERTLG